eukprot:6176245-Pleurochrysis_carterae.AAC.2
MRVRVCAFCAQGDFGRFDVHVLHRLSGVSTESFSGVAQQIKMHDFDGGDAASRRQRDKRSCARGARARLFSFAAADGAEGTSSGGDGDARERAR